jgi:tetratricopeptide (TPR) repeat protein
VKLRVLFSLMFIWGQARAVEDGVGEKVRLADEHLQRGDYATAERLLKVALADTDGEPTENPRRAVLLNNLGFAYQMAGDYARAEACLKRALDLLKSSSDSNELRLAVTIGNLAKLYLENRQFAKAERLGLASLAERVHSLGPLSPELGRILGSLGVLERHRRNHKAAEQYHNRALAIWEKLADGTAVVQTLNNLALVYVDVARHQEALECFERALMVVDASRITSHAVTVTLLSNAGNLQFRLNGPVPAETYYRRAVALAEESVGDTHPLTGRILANFAVVLRQLQKKSEARSMDKRARSILDNTTAALNDRYSVDVAALDAR